MTVVVGKIPPNAFDGGPNSSENLEPFHQAGFFSWGEVQPLVSAGVRTEFPLRLGPRKERYTGLTCICKLDPLGARMWSYTHTQARSLHM